MATFKVRVENIVGAVAVGSELDDWLTSGARMIVDLLPEGKARLFAKSASVDDSGTTVIGYRVIYATRGGIGARLHPAEEQGRLTDVNSLYAPTALDPACTIVDGKIYVYPTGNDRKVYRIAYPTVLNTDSVVADWPTEFEHGIVLYTSIYELLKKIAGTIVEAITLSAIVAPVAPSSPAFTYTDATISSIGAVTIGSLGTAPEYSAPELIFTAIPSALDLSAISVPTAPLDAAYTYASASAQAVVATIIGSLGTPPTYAKPILSITAPPSPLDISAVVVPSAPAAPAYSYTDASATAVSAVTIPALSSAPTFAVTGAPTISYTHLEQYINTDEDLEQAQVEATQVQTQLQDYRVRIEEALNEFNEANVAYQADLQKKISQAQLDIQKAAKDADLATDVAVKNKWNVFQKETALYEHGLKRYAEQIAGYQAEVTSTVTKYSELVRQWQVKTANELQTYQLDIQNELNEFNKEHAEYQATVQKALQQANLTVQEAVTNARTSTDVSIANAAKALEKDVAVYTHKLQKYQEQLTQYQADVNKSVAEYRANLDRVQVARQTELGKFQADIESALNDYNRTVVIYQSTVQKAFQQAQIDLEIAKQNAVMATELSQVNRAKQLEQQVAEYRSELELYGTQVQAYNAQVNSAVQDYVGRIQLATTKLGGYRILLPSLVAQFQQFLAVHFNVGVQQNDATNAV